MKHVIPVIGVSGDIGSFSEQAANHYATVSGIECTLHYLIDMENVLASLESGNIDLGIFPVHNNNGGIVTQAFEAMGRHLFVYVTAFPMDIEQCLLTKSAVDFSNISEVISHPQGLVQCAQFIKQQLPNAVAVEAADTALSARELAEGKYSDTAAVIAPAGCAKHYGLVIAQKAIQDYTPNVTTFIVVKRRHHENT
jgi:prephenate dehydratase